jgi:cation diffusion facilitator CzcD-associated flavoprotein CzcO
MDPDDVVVIGAGPAGLSTSACLTREQVPHVVLERGQQVGSSWRAHYDRLHLHTAKAYSALPMRPWPAAAPRYPARAEVVDYLEAYAREFHVAPRFGVEVERVTRQGPHLSVRTSQGELKPRAVVVATSYNGVPNPPDFPGSETFSGLCVRARDYKNPAPFAGKRTLVVGCGNSGAEIALDLAEHGVETALVVRGPVHVVPRDIFGRPSMETGILLSGLPATMRDALFGPILRLVVGDLSKYGIRRPDRGPNQMIEEEGRVPLLDVGTIAAIKAGKIAVVPAVKRVGPDSVTFADGLTRPFDALLLATGYTPGLDRWIDGFAAIADRRGRPHKFGEETGIEGLYFVGFKNPTTGALREIAIEAARTARAIKRMLS